MFDLSRKFFVATSEFISSGQLMSRFLTAKCDTKITKMAALSFVGLTWKNINSQLRLIVWLQNENIYSLDT